MAPEGTMPRLTSVLPNRFFLLTFGLSWAVWIPLDLAHFGVEPFVPLDAPSPLLRLLGVLMPAAAAILLSARSGEPGELGRMLGRLRIWRVGAGWWAAAVLVQPVLLVGVAATANAVAGATVVAPLGQDAAALTVSTVLLLIAVLGEEIGWHGVGLPGLQQRSSPRRSALVLGVLWATWHVPFWLLLDSFERHGPGYLVLNFLFVLPLAIYTTWFFNGARFSILLPVAFHLVFNIFNTALLPVTMELSSFAMLVVAEWVLAVPAWWVMGRRPNVDQLERAAGVSRSAAV
jgi:membrane protease YdiL (CAAX protease family)